MKFIPKQGSSVLSVTEGSVFEKTGEILLESRKIWSRGKSKNNEEKSENLKMKKLWPPCFELRLSSPAESIELIRRVRVRCGAPWLESIGEFGQNLETVKAHNSIITEFGSLKSGLIGFLVKFTSEDTPQILKFHELNN